MYLFIALPLFPRIIQFQRENKTIQLRNSAHNQFKFRNCVYRLEINKRSKLAIKQCENSHLFGEYFQSQNRLNQYRKILSFASKSISPLLCTRTTFKHNTTFDKMETRKFSSLHLLDLSQIFERLNSFFGITQIGIGFIHSIVKILGKPFGFLCLFMPFIPHECSEVFILRTCNYSPIFHSIQNHSNLFLLGIFFPKITKEGGFEL